MDGSDYSLPGVKLISESIWVMKESLLVIRNRLFTMPSLGRDSHVVLVLDYANNVLLSGHF